MKALLLGYKIVQYTSTSHISLSKHHHCEKFSLYSDICNNWFYTLYLPNDILGIYYSTTILLFIKIRSFTKVIDIY